MSFTLKKMLRNGLQQNSGITRKRNETIVCFIIVRLAVHVENEIRLVSSKRGYSKAWYPVK